MIYIKFPQTNQHIFILFFDNFSELSVKKEFTTK